MSISSKRIEWIDILKLLGILAVFCGHLGIDSIHDFIFSYHVPLFFFISGIFANRNTDITLFQFTKKKLTNIFIPYVFFCILNEIALIVFEPQESPIVYIKFIKQFIFGIRNHMPVVQLWFIPCLLVMTVLFEVVCRICRRNTIIIAAIVVAAHHIFSFAGSNPSWFWNIDSALYYMIWYCLGYLISKTLTNGFQAKDMDLYIIILIVIFEYFVSGKSFLITALLIACNCVLAKLLSLLPFSFLSQWGKETLWLCGNEWLIKRILSFIYIPVLRVDTDCFSPLMGVVFSVLMLICIFYLLIPVEKLLYNHAIKISRIIFEKATKQ